MSAQRIDWTEIHQRMSAAEAAIAHDDHALRDKTRAILKARADALARMSDDEGSRAQDTLEVVAFLLGQEKYGVETHYVREVCPMNELTLLPGAPSFVLGIVNLRGRVLSVIDIGTWTGSLSCTTARWSSASWATRSSVWFRFPLRICSHRFPR